MTEFYREKHVEYIRKISSDTQSFEYLVTQHLRMSGVYWGLTALALLVVDLKAESFSDQVLEWIFTCYDPESGGFSGNTNHDPHMLYTLSALQILALYDQLDKVDAPKVISFVCSLQQPDGSFAGDKWGEIDTRFSYCALSILSMLKALDKIDLPKAVDFIVR